MYFRQSTCDEARRLKLSGWVCNLADGRVQGVASGAEDALAQLHRWLHRGPPGARVDAVIWEPTDEAPTQTEFVVRR